MYSQLSSDSACASCHAPQAALINVYKSAASGQETLHDLSDYSDVTNYPLFLKWQELSQSSDIAPTIVNLIWTDIMVNYVVGIKSTLNARNKFADGKANLTERDVKGFMIRVLRSRRKVQYNLRYGIPGIVFSAIYMMTILWALIF